MKALATKAVIILAALFGLVLTIAGAAGAHIIAADGPLKVTWDSAMLFGFVHVLAAIGAIATPFSGPWVGRLKLASAGLFLVGVKLFSLVLLAKTIAAVNAGDAANPLQALGALAPVGGFSFMFGWIVLAISAALGKRLA